MIDDEDREANREQVAYHRSTNISLKVRVTWKMQNAIRLKLLM